MTARFSTLGCPAWPLSPRPRRGRAHGLRRRRAALPRGRRRALGAARARRGRPAGDAGAARRRRPRGVVRRHPLVLPQPRPGRAAHRVDEARAHGRGGGRARGAAASASSATACSRGRTSRRRGPGSWSRSPSCATGSRGSGRRGLARDARRLRRGRRDARAPRGRRAATGSASSGTRPTPSREFGEEPEAGSATLGRFVRHVHLKDARRAPIGQVPWPPVLPGTRRLPGRSRPRAAAGGGRRALGLVRVGEALAPGDRGAGGGAAALPALGRGRAAGPARDGAHAARESSAAAGCASRSSRAGP